MYQRKRVAAAPRLRRGFIRGDKSRRRHGRDVDLSEETSRGAAAATTRIFRGGRVAARPRPRRGYIRSGRRGRDADVRKRRGPRYADASKTRFKKPARLECMMQDYPKVLACAVTNYSSVRTRRQDFAEMLAAKKTHPDVWLPHRSWRRRKKSASRRSRRGSRSRRARTRRPGAGTPNCLQGAVPFRGAGALLNISATFLGEFRVRT